MLVEGAKILEHDNNLKILPFNKIITITYNEELSIRAPIKFNFEIFISLLFLTFLFSYKLTDYLANFKTIKEKSRIDIVFLLIFFILLFLPMSKINKDEISQQENRILAKYPVFFKENYQINFDYGKEFNNWFNDRFFMRNFFITFYQLFINFVNKYIETNIAVADLKNNFFYFKPQFNGTYLQLSQQDIEKDAKNLDRLKRFCDKNNIKLYLIIVPQKVNIYKEKIPNKIIKDVPVGKQYKNIFKKYNINYIYPYKEFMSEKSKGKEHLYYKSDTHLTDSGMYLTFLSFINVVKKDFSDLTYINIEDYPYNLNKFVNARYYHNSNTLGDMNVATVNNKKYLDVFYKDYQIPYKNIKKVKNSKFYENESNIAKNKYNAFLIGSSYSSKFLKFASHSFKNIYKIEQNFFFENNIFYDDIYLKILRYNPNVLILIFNEGDAHHYLATMYNDKEEK